MTMPWTAWMNMPQLLCTVAKNKLNSSLIPSVARSFVTSYTAATDKANMAGASGGSMGVNKVAKEQLNTNNPYAHHWTTHGASAATEPWAAASPENLQNDS